MITNFNSVATVPRLKGDDATPAGATRQPCGRLPIVEGGAGAHVGARSPGTSCSAGVLTGERASPVVGPPRRALAGTPPLHGNAYGSFSACGLSPFCRIPSLAIFDLHAERRAVDEASRTSSRLE
jgi:hypothetical protein